MINLSNNKTVKFSSSHLKFTILALFLFSGASGLIYESIWTHYLKLLFGHAAYAQSLVLSIFMGGLTFGAYLTGRLNHKIKNPLLIYAVVEAIIGLLALFFHDLYLITQDILFNYIAQNVESNFLFTNIKWLFGILLILPQSILLGTTFPLITNSLLNLSPQKPGRNISLLYFTNSLGASIGVLISGFYLIQTFGLQGTITTAGIINLSIALIIITILKLTPSPIDSSKASSQTISKNSFYYLLIATAFFTGLTSFFYEIAWIRMLTLVLGSTTHAFELMLSAFILGLALGSFWIKKRIDQLKSPVSALAYIHVLMAAFAMVTLVFYESLFDLMQYFLNIIVRNNEGYTIFILINHFFALIVMLPATFFAGMTLPLITNILYKKNKNTKIVAHVYAFNTLGSIIGIVLAMNVLMPLIGTKGIISFGGLLDFILGITLLGYLYIKKPTPVLKFNFIAVALFSVLTFQLIYSLSEFDVLKTASGVFRTGIAKHPSGTKSLFHKDGKLSTVDIIETPEGQVILSNNGKPDAGINMYGSTAGPDETTMILLGAIPLAINPKIKTVANIGIGSGQTVQMLLSHDFIVKVDSIEIEKSVVEALPYFSVYSQLSRYDKRSNIIIDDAKSYFSSSKEKYDLIVSEPPNPWVSGVANLFTTEFYSNIKKQLAHDGILAQWLQLYEINTKTISSIIKALSENFKHYVLYNTDDGNFIIIASDNANLSTLNPISLSQVKANQLLKRIKIQTIDSMQARYLGNKKLFDPFFNSFDTKIASDYHPYIPYQTEKSFFLQENATELTSLHNFPIPINQLLMGTYPEKTLNVLDEPYFLKSKYINRAKAILSDIEKNIIFKHPFYPKKLRYSLMILSNQLFQCKNNNIDNDLIIETSFELVKATTPYLSTQDLSLLWKKLKNAPCYKDLSKQARSWLNLHEEVARHNFIQVMKLSSHLLLNNVHSSNMEIKEYLFSSTLISAIKTGNIDFAKKQWRSYSAYFLKKPTKLSANLRLLKAHLNI